MFVCDNCASSAITYYECIAYGDDEICPWSDDVTVEDHNMCVSNLCGEEFHLVMECTFEGMSFYCNDEMCSTFFEAILFSNIIHHSHVKSKPLKTTDYTMESDILKNKKKQKVIFCTFLSLS